MANDKRTDLDQQDDLIDRTPRSHDNREAAGRPSDKWVPPSYLPVPDPQDGWAFRWIRTSMVGKADNTNVSSKFRQGWVPVKASDHPEIQVMSDRGSEFPDNIEIGGLLLCKAPQEMIDQRNQHYAKVAQTQMEAVDRNFLRENDPRMPLLNPDRKTRTTFGRS